MLDDYVRVETVPAKTTVLLSSLIIAPVAGFAVWTTVIPYLHVHHVAAIGKHLKPDSHGFLLGTD